MRIDFETAPLFAVVDNERRIVYLAGKVSSSCPPFVFSFSTLTFYRLLRGIGREHSQVVRGFGSWCCNSVQSVFPSPSPSFVLELRPRLDELTALLRPASHRCRIPSNSFRRHRSSSFVSRGRHGSGDQSSPRCWEVDGARSPSNQGSEASESAGYQLSQVRY